VWLVWALPVLLGASVGLFGAAAILGALGLAYVCLTLARPAAGLAWTFAFLPLASPSFEIAGIHVQPFELLVWPACLIALAWVVERREGMSRAELRPFVPLVVLGGYFLAASLLVWGDRAALEIRMWGSALLFGLACYGKAADPEFQRHLPRAFVCAAFALCVVGLCQHYLGLPAFKGAEETRDLVRLLLLGDRTPVRLANLSFEHFNSAGAYLSLICSVLFGLALTQRTALLRAATVAALGALYLTYSRGAALATITGCVAATALVVPGRWRLALATGAATIGVTAIVVLLPVLLVSDYGATESLGSRALIWQAYIQAWLGSPFFGLGPGNGFLAAQFLSPFGDEYAAHSNFLYLGADFGILGVLTAVYGFGAVAWRAVRIPLALRMNLPYVLGGVAVVTALAVHSLVDHTLNLFSYRVALFGVLAVSLRTAARPVEQPS
jgi:O-antigen ligase